MRKLVESRAFGRCEYCLLHRTDAAFPHQIDHVISRKHGGLSEPDNLAYACYLCNLYKGSDIASIHPRTGEVVRLIHPPQDRSEEQFRMAGLVIDPLTDVGAINSTIAPL